MSATGLVGFTGFVGSNLASQHRFEFLYNSKTIGEIVGHSFELLVFAGAQSKKWWANANPGDDWDSIQRGLTPLAATRAKKAVLISTIDVIPEAESARGEFADCDSSTIQPYGRNRRRLEKAFTELFPGSLIVRLPALFGPGLKKNVIYDLLSDNMLDKISPESTFQFYDVGRLWSDITLAMRSHLDLVHLFPEPLATGEIATRFFSQTQIGGDCPPAAHYDYRTLHGLIFGGSDSYIENRAGVLARLDTFIRAERQRNST